MNNLRMKKMWLIATALLLLTWAAACGPAQPPNNQEANDSVGAQPADNAASVNETESTAEEPAAPAPTSDAAALLPLPEEPAAPPPIPTPPANATVTDTGLQYIEVEAGSGDLPQEGDIVELHFVGKLSDGTVFGDSYTEGLPLTVILGQEQLFPGWEEGIGLMQAGGTATLIIPPDLAFGAAGAGGVIPPNETLTLDVELLSVETPPQPEEVAEGDYTTTDTGLQYYDIVAGEGEVPEEGDTVTVEFIIWLQDGPRFLVSSDLNGQPLTFVLGAGNVVFPGWDEGVSTMQVGSTRQLVIPPDIGLGGGNAPGIPPDSTLLMEVELVSFEPAAEILDLADDEYTETDTGLRYYDIEVGDGVTPEAGQLVEVHYTGWLTDGTKFDSSLDRGTPFSFPLGQGGVIAGWDEGVATMQVGGIRQLVIPADLAYGEAGSPGAIPPGATLIFRIELLAVR